MEIDAEKFSDTSLLHELCSRDLLTTSVSDEAVSGTCSTLSEFDERSQIPVKIKHCIEKEYVHEIIVDHFTLSQELEKRRVIVAELEKCALAAFEGDSVEKPGSLKGFGRRSDVATPKGGRTPGSVARSARLRLTGESIRKLVRMMSPAARRRHHSTDVHSSGSSLSGSTPTGSVRSISGGCDLEFSSIVISETNASS